MRQLADRLVIGLDIYLETRPVEGIEKLNRGNIPLNPRFLPLFLSVLRPTPTFLVDPPLIYLSSYPGSLHLVSRATNFPHQPQFHQFFSSRVLRRSGAIPEAGQV